MATPDSRANLKEYALRKLGKPVIRINVANEQIEDLIDDALQKYKRYHFDGCEMMYLPHQLTTTDIEFMYIPVSNLVERVTRIIPLNSSGSLNNMFNFDYQFRLNDMRSLINMPTTNYAITQSHLQMLQNLFVGELSFEFNKASGRLFIQADWGDKLRIGDWIIAECYVAVDPEVHNAVYNDSWLKDYVTQLIKRQWGENLKKYGNIEIPGGVILNGKEIYDEAEAKLEELNDSLENKYQPPPFFAVG